MCLKVLLLCIRPTGGTLWLREAVKARQRLLPRGVRLEQNTTIMTHARRRPPHTPFPIPALLSLSLSLSRHLTLHLISSAPFQVYILRLQSQMLRHIKGAV